MQITGLRLLRQIPMDFLRQFLMKVTVPRRRDPFFALCYGLPRPPAFQGATNLPWPADGASTACGVPAWPLPCSLARPSAASGVSGRDQLTVAVFVL